MDCQFGLDLESSRQSHKRIYKAPRENSVTGKHIVQPSSKDCDDKSSQHTVARLMSVPIGKVFGGNARTDHHGEIAIEQCVDESRRTRRIISRIAVNKHENVGLDISEYAPHDVTFTLSYLACEFCTARLSDRDRTIGRIIVVDIYGRARKRSAQIGYDLDDPKSLIVTGNNGGGI